MVTDALSHLPYNLPNTNAMVDATPALANMMHDDELVSVYVSAGCLFSITLRGTAYTGYCCCDVAIDVNSFLVEGIKAGYESDLWCANLVSAAQGIASLTCRDGLWFLISCLMVPHVGDIQECFFCLAYDALGHFRFEKAYEVLH
ncbi:hypothetical protein C0995_004537 [Termitomyces sp. Mi166|nr:hypothetical protein C0995_004537 [Termitomyces sp. Mi166\